MTPVAPPGWVDAEVLGDLLDSLDASGTQRELLSDLVAAVGRFATRTAIFAVNGESFQPLVSHGFVEGELATIHDPSGPLAETARERTVISWSEPPAAPSPLSLLAPLKFGVLIPLVFGDAVPAVVLADSERPLPLEVLRLVCLFGTVLLQNQRLARLAAREPAPLAAPSAGEETKPVPESVAAVSAEYPEPAPVAATVFQEAAAFQKTVEPEPVAAEPAVLEPFAESPAQESQPETFSLAGEPGGEVLSRETPVEPEPPPAAAFPEAGEEFAPEEEAVTRILDVDAIADVKPEDLGLSPEEFERLMGQAAVDWQKPAADWQSTSPPGQDAEVPPTAAAALPDLEDMRLADSSVPTPEVEPAAPAEQQSADQEAVHTPTVEPPETVRSPEEESAHQEAHRFARLLVVEIKLYNEEEVEEGRRQGDLYRRLKTDIDRSREMYEKRARPIVKVETDYLHEELVRILGLGDPGVLGPDYPGPCLSAL
jgi:hypothetical protein